MRTLARRPSRRVAARLTRRRRRRAFRDKLQPTLLTVGLVSAWGGVAQAATTYTANGSLTLDVADGAAMFCCGGSATITPPPPFESLGQEVGDFTAGDFSFSVTVDPDLDTKPTDGFFFAGAIENSDGTSDLVLSFPGDGSVARGVVWTSLFVDGLPDEEKVFEPQVLQQLGSSPVFDQRGVPEPGSQLYRLDLFFSDLIDTPYGEGATLIAFNGPGNTGTVVGTITAEVPEPAGMVMLGGAALLTMGVRRRE